METERPPAAATAASVSVIEERPTALGEDSRLGHIHDFRLELAGADAADLLARTDVIEGAIAASKKLTPEDIEKLNGVAASGKEVRCVRSFLA